MQPTIISVLRDPQNRTRCTALATMLVHLERFVALRSSYIQEALEGFASARFANEVEVGRFLNAQPGFPKITIHQRITDILTRVVYAGYVESAAWGVSLRKGHH